MTKPLSPQEAEKGIGTNIPDFVIEAVNTLLLQRKTTFTQDEIIEGIREASGYKVTRKEIFDKGYLYFEYIFRNAGWDVTYDKPGYNETYPPTFTFKPSR